MFEKNSRKDRIGPVCMSTVWIGRGHVATREGGGVWVLLLYKTVGHVGLLKLIAGIKKEAVNQFLSHKDNTDN